MKKILSLIAVFTAFAISVYAGDGDRIEMEGSFLRQLQKRDSVLIGDQLQYGVLLRDVKEGTRFAFPDYQGHLTDSVETVGSWIMDTVRVSKDKNLYDIQASIVVTSFEEGKHGLQPIYLLRSEDGEKIDTLVFNPLTLDVKALPVDPETFEVHDIRKQIGYPLTFVEILPYIGILAGIALLVLLIVYLIRRPKKDAPEPDEPAHIRALRKLDGLRGDRLWAPEKQKLFYSEVTDVLRSYIVSRYGVDAMEMTTAEILDGLKGKDVPAELYLELKELFETSDYVKFAKMTATEEELAKAVPEAVRFVTETYQREIDKEAGNVL